MTIYGDRKFPATMAPVELQRPVILWVILVIPRVGCHAADQGDIVVSYPRARIGLFIELTPDT